MKGPAESGQICSVFFSGLRKMTFASSSPLSPATLSVSVEADRRFYSIPDGESKARDEGWGGESPCRERSLTKGR
jgi:hypothetical protein